MQWTLHNRESYARWQHERHQEHLDELWKENNPECIECSERSHKFEMLTDVAGEPVHEECSHICIECEQRYPTSMMSWTDCGDHLICMDCDDRGGE